MSAFEQERMRMAACFEGRTADAQPIVPAERLRRPLNTNVERPLIGAR
jgi:hypothetical protein